MLKIFLLTRNETAFIEDWIKYHGYLFGLENIHLLDGSDHKDTLDVYARYTPLGLNVHHSRANLNDAVGALNELMHEHKGAGNYLIKLDTDEFLARTVPFDAPAHNRVERLGPIDTGNTSFLRRPLRRARGVVSEKIMDLRFGSRDLSAQGINACLEGLPITGQKYKASWTAWSLPVQTAVDRPCGKLTRFTNLQYYRKKSFFHSSNFVSVDLGCHDGRTTDQSGAINTGLTVIHYHSTSVEDSVARAKQALLSHGYFTASDVPEKQKEELLRLRASRGKMDSFHKVDLYLAHLDSLIHGSPMSHSSLNLYHPYYRATNSQREITLVRDTLEQADISGKGPND